MKAYSLLPVLLLAACGQVMSPAQQEEPVATATAATSTEAARPEARPASGIAPPVGARTEEEFDTTSAEERAAAAAPSTGGESRLGTTVVSLGDPSKPGFWLETPLVSAERQGRVVFPATGKSAQVTLTPIDGPATGGSRISLAAMRLIEAPLTDLPTVEVYAGG
ncbi:MULTISPECIES: hypothetical protein [Salipiger]|uniref:hypothetical protein n=1 Tax=Salipiger TaxID=263377 RepID=UPI0030083CC7